MESPLKISREGSVLEVVLDRPKANAIDVSTSREMGEVFAEFRDDPDLRVAIITGGGEEVLLRGVGPQGGRRGRIGGIRTTVSEDSAVSRNCRISTSP